MNQNRKYKKAGVAGVSAALIMALSVGGVMSYASETKNTLVNETIMKDSNNLVKEEKKTAKKKTEDTNQVFKDEVVYAYTDANGKVNKVTVSEWLKNSAGKNTLKDKTTLQDIKNVKGEETFTKGDKNTISWNTADSDIYYQGTANEELPIAMEVTYYLDGKKVTPQELVGKSGKFKMHVTYKNNSRQTVLVDKEEVEVNTPFAMVTAMILPEEKFANVNIDHGKVLSDGNRTIAIGLGMPGMQESLDIDEDMDVEIPESFVMTADVTDFEMSSTFTVATSDLFEDFNMDSDTIDDLKDSLNELTDASLELVDGSSDLSKGIKTLKDSTGEFTKGIQTLSQGVGKLSEGADDLQSGTKEYTDGVETLAGGVKQYVDGTTTLADGVASYTNGAKKLQQGIQSLSDETKDLPSSLDTLSKGIETYGTGVNKLVSEENMNSLTSGTSSLAAGIEKVNQGLDTVSAGVETIHQNLADLEASYSNNEQLIAGLKSVMETMEEGQQKAQIQAMVINLETVTTTQKAGIAALKDSTSKNSQLSTGLNSLIGSTDENGALLQGAKSLSNAAQTMSAASVQLREAYPGLSQGAAKLAEAGKSLPAAMKQLTTGAKELVSNNKDLQNGAKKLKSSGKTLNSGAKTLKGNSSALLNGVKTLNNGVSALLTGAGKLESGTGKLTEGVDKLFNGSVDLKEGMEKFNEEGIEKLTGTVEDDLEILAKHIEAITEAGKSYKTYAGIHKDMDGSVKFIIKSDEIK